MRIRQKFLLIHGIPVLGFIIGFIVLFSYQVGIAAVHEYQKQFTLIITETEDLRGVVSNYINTPGNIASKKVIWEKKKDEYSKAVFDLKKMQTGFLLDSKTRERIAKTTLLLENLFFSAEAQASWGGEGVLIDEDIMPSVGLDVIDTSIEKWIKVAMEERLKNYSIHEIYFAMKAKPERATMNPIMQTELVYTVEKSEELIKYLDYELLPRCQDCYLRLRNAANFEVPINISIILIISILVIGFVTLIALNQTKKILNNINLISKTITEFSKGNFSVNIDLKTNDEFGLLANNFNILSTELWARIDGLKDIMQDVGNSINTDNESNTIDIQEFYDYAIELAIDSTGADAGIILTIEKDEERDENVLKVAQMNGLFPLPVDVPKRVLGGNEEILLQYFKNQFIPIDENNPYGKAVLSKEPCYIKDNGKDEIIPINANPEIQTYLKSAIIVPLDVGGTLHGLLALCTRSNERVFSDLDFVYMRSYGSFIAVTTDTLLKYVELLKKHEITREVEIGIGIQKSLLPQKMPVFKHAEVGAFSEAAKGVSGDYYDVFRIDDNHLGVIVCDVSGKGIPASLLMVMIRTVLRATCTPGKNARRVMFELNKAITGKLSADRFATIGFYILNQQTGELSYCNAAHHPLYIYRAQDKKFRKFDTVGFPVGVDTNAQFGHKKIKVQKGDYLILYTDGLPEARNPEGEEMGEEIMLKFIAKNADLTAVDMAEKMKKFLDYFVDSAKQHDDETFLAMKII